MNKALLIWNIVITIALVVGAITGCSALDPQYASTAAEVRTNRALIEQIANLANQNREAINGMSTDIMKNTLAIANQQTTTQAAITALDNSLQQYVQQYVQAYVAEVVQ